MKTRVTPERAKEIWAYDSVTGLLTWRIRANQGILAGSPAGTIDDRGYVAIRFKYVTYKGHQIAWAIQTGEWPPNDVDHINSIKSDNRFKNLRLATRRQNTFNTGKRLNNTSGYRGASFHKKTGRWQASIRVNDHQKYLGLYASPELAHAAYCAAAKVAHGDFYRP